MNRLQVMQRKTQRATINLPQGVLEDLLAIADQDGRSLSNLIAYMVESRLEDYKKGRG
jgi:metal-responsive CopG/Arc/MetJ family transcriptional regulator